MSWEYRKLLPLTRKETNISKESQKRKSVILGKVKRECMFSMCLCSEWRARGLEEREKWRPEGQDGSTWCQALLFPSMSMDLIRKAIGSPWTMITVAALWEIVCRWKHQRQEEHFSNSQNSQEQGERRAVWRYIYIHVYISKMLRRLSLQDLVTDYRRGEKARMTSPPPGFCLGWVDGRWFHYLDWGTGERRGFKGKISAIFSTLSLSCPRDLQGKRSWRRQLERKGNVWGRGLRIGVISMQIEGGTTGLEGIARRK